MLLGGLSMLSLLRDFYRDESAATLVEYAALASLIAVVAIATILILGARLDAAYQAVLDELDS